jgi:arylsulfatase A-like enzyme
MTVKNVLLVTVDSLRYDRALTPDRAEPPAPQLSRLAATGTSFRAAYANGPNTPSSFPTILTSTHPAMYGGYRYLDERRPFVSATLNEAGFTTVGYHSNPHLGPEKNYHHGFETFNDSDDTDDDRATIKNFVDERVPADSRLYSLLRRVYHLFTMATDSSAYEKAPVITDRAIDWFDTTWDGEQPFFMWLHYMDVHYPFDPPDRFLEELDIEPPSTRRTASLNGKMQESPEELTEADRETLLALYDGEIRYTDHHLGRLLAELERQGIREETAVIVTADHGEAFGEHDRYGHHPYLYDELLHVPLVMDIPGLEPRTIDEVVSLIDLGPTVHELLNVPIPEAVQGRSLVPLLRGEAAPAEDSDDKGVICTAAGGEMLAYRTDQWKLFWQREAETLELYDLKADPAETTNVIESHPEVAARLHEQLEAHIAAAEATDTELPEVTESEAVKQRLEDLGYVD